METMPTATLSAPPFGHPGRALFEHAVTEGNIAIEHLARLDPFIENARTKAPIDDTMRTQICDQQTTLWPIIEKSQQDPLIQSNHTYRLIATTETLEEMISVPEVFARNTSTREERIEATQHLAGIHAALLQGLLIDHGRATTERDRQDYVGLISEQTFLAAINSAYNEDIAATQSLAYQDYDRQTDATIYMRTNDGFYEVPVQVKTSAHQSQRTKGIAYIYMRQFNGDFQLSHGLIHYMNHGNLDDYTRRNIHAIVRHVKRAGANIAPKQSLQ